MYQASPVKITVASTPALPLPVRVAILRLLSDGNPRHGYALMRELGAIRPSGLTVSPGAVYPALRWLQHRGYVASSVVGRRKMCLITGQGKAFLKEQLARQTRWSQPPSAGLPTERGRLAREARLTSRLVLANTRYLNPGQAREISWMLSRARLRLARFLGTDAEETSRTA